MDDQAGQADRTPCIERPFILSNPSKRSVSSCQSMGLPGSSRRQVSVLPPAIAAPIRKKANPKTIALNSVVMSDGCFISIKYSSIGQVQSMIL
jgi:hypothetical protein